MLRSFRFIRTFFVFRLGRLEFSYLVRGRLRTCGGALGLFYSDRAINDKFVKDALSLLNLSFLARVDGLLKGGLDFGRLVLNKDSEGSLCLLSIRPRTVYHELLGRGCLHLRHILLHEVSCGSVDIVLWAVTHVERSWNHRHVSKRTQVLLLSVNRIPSLELLLGVHRRIVIHIVVRHHEHGGYPHAWIRCLHPDRASRIVHSWNLRRRLVHGWPPTRNPIWSCFPSSEILVSVGVSAAILIRTVPVVIEELAFDGLIVVIIEKVLTLLELSLRGSL